MKIAYIAASVAALSISFASADCDCDPYDTGCLNDCVGNTNSCISESNSNDCYNNCISDHWPGEQESTPTASWANGESSIRPTTTSTSYWSQSSGWPSIATWGPNSSGYSGTSPSAASTSAVHSGSSATYRMSKVVVGLSLAAAAYMLQ